MAKQPVIGLNQGIMLASLLALGSLGPHGSATASTQHHARSQKNGPRKAHATLAQLYSAERFEGEPLPILVFAHRETLVAFHVSMIRVGAPLNIGEMREANLLVTATSGTPVQVLSRELVVIDGIKHYLAKVRILNGEWDHHSGYVDWDDLRRL